MVTARSARASTVVSAEALSLALFGSPKSLPTRASLARGFPSGVSLVTVAVSLISTCSVAVSDTRIVVRPPAGSEPRLQVIVPSASAQAPSTGGLKVADVMVKGPLPTLASFTTTFRASDGPRLSTRIWQVAVPPARSGSSGLQSLVSLRSARSFTIVDVAALLLDVSGSGSSAGRLAVLVKTSAPLARTKPESTRAWMVNVRTSPGLRAPSVQVRSFGEDAGAAHGTVLVRNDVPAGRTSTTTTLFAGFEPLL